MVFGVLWGSALALLAVNPQVAVSNLALAMLLSYVLRYRIDCLNHGIAASIAFLAFFMNGPGIDWPVFLFFFTVFAVGGFIKDSLVERPTLKNVLGEPLTTFFEYRMHIYFFPFLYSASTGFWLAFFVASAHMFSYELVRQYFWKFKAPKKP